MELSVTVRLRRRKLEVEGNGEELNYHDLEDQMFSVIDSSLLVVSVLVSICNGCVPCSKAKTFLETLQTSSPLWLMR